MADFVLLLIVNAFAILGFYEATQPNMILWYFKKKTKKLPVWVRKPLYDCPTCMASLHSTYIYFGFYGFHLELIGNYIIYVFALAGLSFFVNMMVPGE